MLWQVTSRLTLWLAALLDELLLWREDRLMPQLSNEVLHPLLLSRRWSGQPVSNIVRRDQDE